MKRYFWSPNTGTDFCLLVDINSQTLKLKDLIILHNLTSKNSGKQLVNMVRPRTILFIDNGDRSGVIKYAWESNMDE